MGKKDNFNKQYFHLNVDVKNWSAESLSEIPRQLKVKL